MIGGTQVLKPCTPEESTRLTQAANSLLNKLEGSINGLYDIKSKLMEVAPRDCANVNPIVPIVNESSDNLTASLTKCHDVANIINDFIAVILERL